MKRSKSGGKICDFCEKLQIKKNGNFCEIQKLTEQYKAVKEEVERASTKPVIFVKLSKNWTNMK